MLTSRMGSPISPLPRRVTVALPHMGSCKATSTHQLCLMMSSISCGGNVIPYWALSWVYAAT